MDDTTHSQISEVMAQFKEYAESNRDEETPTLFTPHGRAQFTMAGKFLKRFFDGKNGKGISEKVLLTEDHLSLVLNTDTEDGIILFYEILGIRDQLSNVQQIRYLVEALHECRRLRIPKNLIGGIVCVHAKLVGHWVTSTVPMLQPFFPDIEDDEVLEPADEELKAIEEFGEVIVTAQQNLRANEKSQVDLDVSYETARAMDTVISIEETDKDGANSRVWVTRNGCRY